MTNHWRDIKNTDLILINGANPAEAHPVGFQWFLAAKNDPKRGPGSGGGAKMFHDEYVRNYTNASFLVKPAYGFKDGLFTGYDAANRKYDIASWGYQADDGATAAATAAGLPTNGAVNAIAKRDMTLQ